MSMMNISRRGFLKTTGVVGGGLVIGFFLTRSGEKEMAINAANGSFVPNSFLQITPDNKVHFYCPRDEMGQGVTTGLATLVAEELDIAPAKIVVELASAHDDYANPDFGIQITGGSTSMKVHFHQLRQVAANVRAMLIQAAATDLGVPVRAITTQDSHMLVKGELYPYGQFVATANTLEPPKENAPLKPNADFKYIGTEFARLDGVAKSTGTAVYGIDVDIPNMHHAVVKRCPVAGGSLASVDKSAALRMPGVTDVVEIFSGVAVVAEKFWQARQALVLLEPKWNLPELAKVSTKQVQEDYQDKLENDEGVKDVARGDLSLGFAEAKSVVEQQYWTPYLAHAPMEPMSTVIRIENGEADVWSGTQAPGAAQGLTARYANLDKENVRVHAAYLGGGFGRRATLTHIAEAAELAVASNKPIHLLWTREDDIRHGVYRPASLMKIKAGVNESGKVTSWQAKRVGGNITPDTFALALPGMLPTAVPDAVIGWIADASDSVFGSMKVDHSSIEGLYEDYDFPNREVRHVTKNHDLPLTFWRSVGHSFTSFAKESLIDELAEKSQMDKVDFRLRNTQDNPRLHKVIEIAGRHMRKMQLPQGHELGFAAHGSFGSFVAQAAEVSVQQEQIRVHKVLCVVDCGLAVNPDIVRAQMEGGIMFGLTAALHGELKLQNGAIKESNFHDYPILRMDEAPAVEVVIVDSEENPTGVGEPGLPPIAPAVANAVYAITGRRLTSLPLKLA